MAIKHLSPRSKKEIRTLFQDKYFQRYWNKKLKSLRVALKRDKISLKEFTNSLCYKSVFEYKYRIYKNYSRKCCQSFTYKVCMSTLCIYCNHYYSQEDYNNYTLEEKENIKR